MSTTVRTIRSYCTVLRSSSTVRSGGTSSGKGVLATCTTTSRTLKVKSAKSCLQQPVVCTTVPAHTVDSNTTSTGCNLKLTKSSSYY